MTRYPSGIATGLLVAMAGFSTPAFANGGIGAQWAETYFRKGGDDAPACGACHTMAAAQTSGQVGPNLDQLKPGRAKVRAAVHDGVGVMPSFSQALSDAEIDAIAKYVADAVK